MDARVMQAIAAAVVDFGLVAGKVPEPCTSRGGTMVVVAHAADAVVLRLTGKVPPQCFGGLTVSARAPARSLRDALVGWVVPGRGFRWARQDASIIPAPWYECVDHPGPDDGEDPIPVWLTCCSYEHSMWFRDCRVAGVAMGDFAAVAACYERACRRAAFWEAARQEFVAATWHPGRVMSWCFDSEERADFAGTCEDSEARR